MKWQIAYTAALWAVVTGVGMRLQAQGCGSVNSSNGVIVNLADPNGCNCNDSYAFYDDGGPNQNYSNNRRDTVRFVSPGRRLRIRFNRSSLQSGVDPLYIYDGNVTPGGPVRAGLMWRLSSTSYPSVLFSTQDTVTFIFYSDGSSVSAGWEALIDCLPVGAGGQITRYDLSGGNPTRTVSCTSPVSFYDGGGPHNLYPESVDDTVTFVPASSTERLMVAFTHQLSLANGDTLWAYENSLTASNLLAVFTAGSSRAETLLTGAPGNSLIFRFKSDFDGQLAGGWGAIIACASSGGQAVTYMGLGVRRVQCGITYRFLDSGSPGLIWDDGRSNYGNYANGENRLITFVSQNNAQTLRLQVTSLYTEANYDWFEVYDGPTPTSPLIGRWSGTAVPPVINSSGPALTVRFQSDAGANYSGWEASVQCTGLPVPPTYTLTSASQTVTTCNALFYDEGGAEGPYTTTPQDRAITFCPENPTDYLRVRFPRQFILAAGDTMWVYQGSVVDPARLVGVYVRRNIGEEIACQVPGTCLTFRFKAMATSPRADGWHGIVECTPAPQPSVTCMQGAGIRRTCNLILYDDGGPNANYRNSARDTLILVSPTSCGLNIQFTQFDTQSNSDLLSLYDGGSTTAPLIGQYSGASLPNQGNPITASGDSLTLRFLSSAGTNDTGWQARVSCPNSFTVTVTPSSPVQICRGASVTLTASGAPAGSTYTWAPTSSTGPTLTVNTPGNYTVTATSPNGCSATSGPVSVSYHPSADTTLTIVRATLSNNTCNSAGYTCTWYNCTSNQVVGTGASFTATDSGWYALIIRNTGTGCADTSSCYYIDPSGSALAMPHDQTLRLYPNPTRGTSTIESPTRMENVEVWDMQGRRVFEARIEAFMYELPALPQGHYKVRVQLQNATTALLSWQILP